jgi:hypothetical protein
MIVQRMDVWEKRYGPRVPKAAGDVYMDHSCADKGSGGTA